MADGGCHGQGLELLQKCSKPEAEKITHELLDCICTGKSLRYQSYGKIWTIEEWNLLQQAGMETLKGFTARGLDKEQISKELDRFSLSSEVKQAVLDCLWPRQEEVRQSLVLKTAAITNSYLKDFDWKVKMTMSSDKLASIKEPTVTVDFDIDESGKDRNVSVELRKEELDNLISSLEAANKVVMQLKK
ncbi:COMM domain [Desmophyllum pertusum]|uniref:COMM domain n=1 Tax=Desmophyllum pertusum TaxID=174260 RepID=A0A9X0D294_9CNID|nr:COMM domain [Desmophyllum pertusum]KAJ7392928.1 COMM domain [Desmophyllum pertusum]